MQLRTRKIEVEIKVGDITVQASPLDPIETAALRDRFTGFKGRGAERRERFDSTGFAEAMFLAVVKSWDGAVDEDGKPMECNDANKKLVYRYDQDFVSRVLDGIREAVERMEEDRAKN